MYPTSPHHVTSSTMLPPHKSKIIGWCSAWLKQECKCIINDSCRRWVQRHDTHYWRPVEYNILWTVIVHTKCISFSSRFQLHCLHCAQCANSTNGQTLPTSYKVVNKTILNCISCYHSEHCYPSRVHKGPHTSAVHLKDISSFMVPNYVAVVFHLHSAHTVMERL